MDVELLAVLPALAREQALLHHHLAVVLDALAMKRGLRQAALPFVQLAFAREQAFAEDDFRALQGQAFDEGRLPGHEHLAHEVGMIEEEEAPRADLERRSVAVRPGELREERQRAILHRAQIGAGKPVARAGRNGHALCRTMNDER
jgi:hypothetical protein